MSEDSNKPEPRKFLMAPAIIDWLQWCDELETPLGKPDYPQLALTLIAEYKAEIKALRTKPEARLTDQFYEWWQIAEDERDKLKVDLASAVEALTRIANPQPYNVADKIACIMSVAAFTEIAREALDKLGEK